METIGPFMWEVCLSLNHIYWNNIPNIINQKDKKVGLIFGTDKSQVFKNHNTGKLYTRAIDGSLLDYGAVTGVEGYTE